MCSQGELAEQMGRENERLAARVRQYPPKGRAALKRFKDPRLDNREPLSIRGSL